MANPTPSFHTPVLVKNQSGRYVSASNTAQCRKAWDPTLAGTVIAARGLTFGASTFAVGATIDPGAVGMSEGQLVDLWRLGWVDWA